MRNESERGDCVVLLAVVMVMVMVMATVVAGREAPHHIRTYIYMDSSLKIQMEYRAFEERAGDVKGASE